MNATLAFIVLLLPLAGFLFAGLAGKNLPKNTTGVIASLAVLGSFLISLYLFGQIGQQPEIVAHGFTWVSVGDFSIPFSLLVDRLSGWMMLIITGIGFLIHVYSIGYMHEDKGFYRFFAYLNLFVFSMLLLVMSDNYVLLFFGWEGVGLCSYLLIGFWFDNVEYGKAARKAFIMNRIGDLGLLLGIFLIATHFGSVRFTEVWQALASGQIGAPTLTLITLLLLVGAVGKSAQIPLYTWLPDAMAGPTPVSALIHAATMVTAGIYLVVRSALLYQGAPLTNEIIMAVGLATSLFAGLIALRQNDIKKVLAYSTVSQLGLMFLAAGAGAYVAAMFHLTTHAFFKALLFLGAGSVIHGLGGEQDLRQMGGLRNTMPHTFRTFLAGTLAIIGFPLLSGFFSKDEILAAAYGHHPIWWILAVASSAITAVYMLRLLFLTFYGTFRGSHDVHPHESPAIMTIPLAVLAVLSVLGGLINLPALIAGEQGQWLSHFMSTLPGLKAHHHALSHSTEWLLMGATTLMVLVILALSYQTYVKKGSTPVADASWAGWERWLGNKGYVDELYAALFVKPLEKLSAILHRWIDTAFIDGLVNRIGAAVVRSSDYLRRLQNGNIEFYLFGMVLGVILILLLNHVI